MKSLNKSYVYIQILLCGGFCFTALAADAESVCNGENLTQLVRGSHVVRAFSEVPEVTFETNASCQLVDVCRYGIFIGRGKEKFNLLGDSKEGRVDLGLCSDTKRNTQTKRNLEFQSGRDDFSIFDSVTRVTYTISGEFGQLYINVTTFHNRDGRPSLGVWSGNDSDSGGTSGALEIRSVEFSTFLN